jgi:glycosyltransferase involved in cell wall biosynthesis
MVICISANTSWYLFNFRQGLIRRLVEEGYQVIALAPLEERYSRRLEELGCIFVPLSLAPHHINPVKEIFLIAQYLRVFLTHRPELVMLFTIKPVIFGSFAALFSGRKYVCTLTGLGSFFLRSKSSELIFKVLLRLALARATTVFTQNPDDYSFVRQLGLKPTVKTQVVHGSGINLARFSFSPLVDGPVPIFLLVARMIRDKGVVEFIDAARKFRKAGLVVDCRLIGPIGVNNPTAISADELNDYVSDGTVVYLGEVDDVRVHLRQASCIVLPSYREGMSRVLLEASATGRPIIASDVPGCREIVENGFNGFLCSPKSSESLAEAMRKFFRLTFEEKQELGKNARLLSERFFSEEKVNNTYLDCVHQALDS